MPLVKIQYNERSEEIAKSLAAHMPYVVASALTCDNPAGKLTMEDVEVELGPIPPPRYMPQKHDLRIYIEANEYPERLANLETRQEAIVTYIKRFLESEHFRACGFVWVRLTPGSFGEF